MDCVRAQQLIRPYLEGILSDRELEEFLDHVQRCQTCFGELEVYFSIYRTLNNVDEKGDYNYEKKLRAKLNDSREYLRVRQRNRVIKVAVILAAEVSLGAAIYTMFRMPGGYIDRHRTELIPVVETEVSAGEAALAQTGQPDQGQAGQAEQGQTGQLDQGQTGQAEQGQTGQPEQTQTAQAEQVQTGQPEQAQTGQPDQTS